VGLVLSIALLRQPSIWYTSELNDLSVETRASITKLYRLPRYIWANGLIWVLSAPQDNNIITRPYPKNKSNFGNFYTFGGCVWHRLPWKWPWEWLLGLDRERLLEEQRPCGRHCVSCYLQRCYGGQMHRHGRRGVIPRSGLKYDVGHGSWEVHKCVVVATSAANPELSSFFSCNFPRIPLQSTRLASV
jgi:hypothetical protein